MPKILSQEVDTIIKTLSNDGNPPIVIKDKLKKLGYEVTTRTIYRSIRNIGKTRSFRQFNGKNPVFERIKTVRTKENILKVKQLVSKETPLSYRDIKNKMNISLQTINNGRYS